MTLPFGPLGSGAGVGAAAATGSLVSFAGAGLGASLGGATDALRAPAQVELGVLVLAGAGLERGLALAGDIEPAGIGRLDLVRARFGADELAAAPSEPASRRPSQKKVAATIAPRRAARPAARRASCATTTRAAHPRRRPPPATAAGHRHSRSIVAHCAASRSGKPTTTQLCAIIAHALAQHFGMRLRRRAHLQPVIDLAVAQGLHRRRPPPAIA